MGDEIFDTYVTVVGNVLTAPEWRRTTQTGTVVASFKVASTARRLDRETNRWVDGNSLRVRVTCWRRLAEGVSSSVMTGDPVIVVGRLYTRDWVDADNNHRTAYELEAVAVGHDLSRGQSRFERYRPAMTTSTVEDPESDQQVRGEPSTPVEAPGGAAPSFDDELAGLISAGAASAVDGPAPAADGVGAEPEESAPDEAAPEVGSGRSSRRPRIREPQPA